MITGSSYKAVQDGGLLLFRGLEVARADTVQELLFCSSHRLQTSSFG